MIALRFPIQYVRRCGLAALQILLLLLIAACSTARQPNPNASKDERIALFRETVDKVFRHLESKQGPGLAVWVEVEEQVIYSNWAGLANSDLRVPIDGNTVFELASASKPLTAAAVLQLAESGLLKLDDAAVRWIPELPSEWSAISVRDLLTQSAGIPDYMKLMDVSKLRGLDGLTNKQLLQRWGTSTRLNFPSGTDVEYSNSNYVLLAEIVARVCGTSFGQCLQQRMFVPLGMTRTKVESQEAVQGESLALNYADSTLTNGIQLRTEGPTGIYSSLSDIATWLRAYQAGKIVSKPTVALMTTPASPRPAFASGERYGMGWALPAENSPTGAYAHSGQKDGYRALIRANPPHHVNYIILSNGGDLIQPTVNEVRYWIQQFFENFPWNFHLWRSAPWG